MQDTQQRNDTIADYTALARRISLKTARLCPAWIQREDMIAAGMLGLTEAATRFDASRKEHFVAFATGRIRGAVIDELRRGDILPRRMRQISRQIGRTVRDLESSGVPATDQRIADALEVTVEVYLEKYAYLATAGYDRDVDADLIVDHHTLSPRDIAERNQTMTRIDLACAQLEKRDAHLITLYYRDDLSFVEIGAQLGITSSRVSQLVSRALRRLRLLLEEPVALAA